MKMKCPYCGSDEMLRAKPENSNEMHIVLSATKRSDGFEIHGDTGVPVRLIYCNNCKMVNFELALKTNH